MRKYIAHAEGTRGTETSKYPEEEKEKSIPIVAASEVGIAQTLEHAPRGCGPAKQRLLLIEHCWKAGPESVKAA